MSLTRQGIQLFIDMTQNTETIDEIQLLYGLHKLNGRHMAPRPLFAHICRSFYMTFYYYPSILILILILCCLKKNIYCKPGQTRSFQTNPDSEGLQFVIACLFLSLIDSLLFLRPLLCLSGSVGGHPALHGQSGDEERQP